MNFIFGTNGDDDYLKKGSNFDDAVLGFGGNDILSGLGGNDHLFGGDGFDQLLGSSGADHLYGGDGPDWLTGGSEGDYLDGGDDTDVVRYPFSDFGVYVDLETGVGKLGDAEGDTLVDIEDIFGSQHGDTLVGNGEANELWGWEGADSLFGGHGIDNLHGGLGADAFRWRSTHETGTTAATADVIWDFNSAQGDRIVFETIDADIYATGNQAFTFIGAAAFTSNRATLDASDVVPGEIRYYHAGGDTYIELQTGNSPDVEGVIRIDGIVNPQASWFVL